MSLFLSAAEQAAIKAGLRQEPLSTFYWAMRRRVEVRAETPGLLGLTTDSGWWFCAAEYLSDAAMIQALTPNDTIAIWLRDVSLSLARRSVDDWVGPFFRNHTSQPPVGHLETAHLSFALAIVLDLAPGVFTEAEREEITSILRERAIPMCQRWLARARHLANWRCVLNAGVSVAAAVLNDTEAMASAAAEWRLCANAFQPDGSYAESLQYGNYALYTMTLSWEALTRRTPELAASLDVSSYAGYARWAAASHFYLKPLSGWGPYPRPRAANFNDSAAAFVPSGDVLLHLATRGAATCPTEAGLARWLFDTVYGANLIAQPHDRASFGFVNDFDFLTLPLLHQATTALPREQVLSTLETFSCGDVLARDAWGGRTVLAVHGGGDPLCGPGHLHGDLNSFILVHNQERMLVDPGHSCYRNLLHKVEVSSATHNTCTFVTQDGRELQQATTGHRLIDGELLDRGARRLIASRQGDITVIGSEAAKLYGQPLERFARFWFLCGSHVLFIVDQVVASEPVRPHFHWLLNNRDGLLDLKVVPPDRLVARRGAAGMKLFNVSGATLHGPAYAHVHDAYHPLPSQLGEGRSGTGMLMTFSSGEAATEHLGVHAICLDHYGSSAGWHLRSEAGYAAILESPGASQVWKLRLDWSTGMRVEEAVTGQAVTLSESTGIWKLS